MLMLEVLDVVVECFWLVGVASEDLVNEDSAAVEDAWPLFWVVALDGGTTVAISPVGPGLGSCLASC